MADTIESLNAELIQVNNALADLISGNRTSELLIGSGSTQRRYKFSEITPEFLTREKLRITNALAMLENTSVIFRDTSFMRTTYRKW